jgi:type IV pilus assembly protein PilP
MSMLRSSTLIRALALLGVVALAACSRGVERSPDVADNESNLQAWVAEVDKRPPPPLEPLPVMQQFESFEYAAQALRDPFSRAFRDVGGAGPRPDANRAKQELENFPLDSLDMVGTIGSGRGLTGLVKAPDKMTYKVRPGSYLGQSDGRVTSVSEDRIDLVELVTDGAGGWLERPASIALEDQ